MSTIVETAIEIPPFHVDVPAGGAGRPSPTNRGDALRQRGDGRV